jgi:hypothetical protein
VAMKRPANSLIRGRVRGDIERYFSPVSVTVTPHSDYLYRTTQPRRVVAQRIRRAVENINYPSFKGSVTDERREDYLLRIWGACCDMQDALKT